MAVSRNHLLQINFNPRKTFKNKKYLTVDQGFGVVFGKIYILYSGLETKSSL